MKLSAGDPSAGDPSAVVGLKYTPSQGPLASISWGASPLDEQHLQSFHAPPDVPGFPANETEEVKEAAAASTDTAQVAVEANNLSARGRLREGSAAQGQMPSFLGNENKERAVPVETTVNIVNTSYKVTVREGRWWKGCCFRPKVKKVVLQDINVQLRSGQLTAVLGNSGSGKTSLLDLIAGKVKGEVSGAVYLDRTPLDRDVFRTVGGYVIQADRLLANLTVQETLEYTAQLKFLGTESRQKVREKVHGVIEDMGLRHVTNTIIGGLVTRGISGGEKRRVSIAVQLLQDPYLLLLDEPTSGLDSFTAHSLVQSLAALAHTHNKILLLSVHQPRSDIFRLFDQVGLLCRGEMIYFGPREKLVQYFTNQGHPCPTYANPLDHYVDIASIDHRSDQREYLTSQRVDNLKETYRESDIFVKMQASMEDVLSAETCFHPREKTARKLSIGTRMKNKLSRTWILLKRLSVNLVRDRSGLAVRICSLMAFAFFIWIFVMELGNDASSIQDRTGVFFETMSGTAMIGLMNSVAMFPPLRDLHYRESGDDLYGSIEMLVSYYIHILPFNIISSLIFSTWVYWGIGLYPEGTRFLIFFCVVTFCQLFGELQGIQFMGIWRNEALAHSVTTIILACGVLIGTGLLKTFETMLVPLQWLAWITWYKYATEIMVANEYHLLEFTCPDNATEPCEFYSGDTYLEVMFPNALDNMGMNWGIMCAFLGGYWIMDILTFLIRGERHLY